MPGDQVAPHVPAGGTTSEQLLHILADGSRAQLGHIHDASQMLSQPADVSQRQALERLQRAVRELGTLISDVRDFHAYSAGRLDEVDSEFDLRVTLEGIRARLAPAQDPAARVAVTRIRHDVPPLLKGKPARLQDILLGAGATMFSTCLEGTLRIDVSKTWERDNAVGLVFQCELRSPRPPTLEEVNAFRSALSTREDSQRLSQRHLRLQLARRLVLADGGSLTASEDCALGFELSLPFAMRSLPEPTPERVPQPALRGRRALIVDASEARRNRMSAILGLWGLQTETCGSTRVALEALKGAAAQGDPFDFALVDAELEDTDGLVAGRLFREQPSIGQVRLLLLFGMGLRGDATVAERIGYDAYLPRTILIHELREALLLLLQRASSNAQSAPIVTRHSLADVRLEAVQILLLSDDPVGGLVLEAVLRRKGFHVDRVGRIAQAAERCEKTQYDYLVLDVGQMSESDLILATGLRALADEHGPTPVAALVEASTMDEVAGLAGFSPDAVFAKPVDLDQICSFCEGSLYPELAAKPTAAPRPGDAIVYIVSATTGQENSTVFERERLDEATMGIHDLQVSVLESYLDEMPRRAEAISAAILAADAHTAGSAALSARAMALTIGAYSTAQCLGLLGEQIERGRLAEAQSTLARVRAEVEKSSTLLRDAHASIVEGTRRAA